MNVEWLAVVGVLAAGATMSVAGLTLVLGTIVHELRELNAHLRGNRGDE